MDLLADKLIEGVEFKNQDFSNKILDSKYLDEVRFNRCNFGETVFNGCTFRNCTFTKCDLSLARVKNSRFANVQFEGCKVVGVNWTEAAWEKGTLLRLIDFDDCALNYSSFFGLKLSKMRMTRCIAREVDFGEADLTAAVFSDTDLSGSTFMHTNLTDADFTSALNYAISAQNNTLKKTKFSLPEALSLLRSLDIILVDPSEGT